MAGHETYIAVIARRTITGTNWNGYTFFGVKRRPATNKNAKVQRQATHDEQIAVADKILSAVYKSMVRRMRNPGKLKTLRCAIYTRKSSTTGIGAGLQLPACAARRHQQAFIASQRHEGWLILPALYDDGGYSGGSMERPALRQLLADIAVGVIDVVVVYKVDRLTRSLADFAKIVEVFDGRGVSFVSVTQQFNTTSSMGRLTLNVLLSFAQFEREVTGERIRDKIAASKKKGIWMGGVVPLGYDAKARTLVINEAEAEIVRTIFKSYLELGTVQALQTELDKRGLKTKRYVTVQGRMIGDRPFSRGHSIRFCQIQFMSERSRTRMSATQANIQPLLTEPSGIRSRQNLHRTAMPDRSARTLKNHPC